MRRRVKFGIVLILLLTGAGILGIEYVNRVILPVKVRGWAESSLSQALGRQVTIGRIRIHPWHGLLIEQVALQEDARYGKQPFLQIEQISARILYLPFFKNQELIIPTLRIVRPRVHLIQDPNGIWNIQSLQWKRPSQVGRPSRFHLLIPRIVVIDAQLNLNLQKSSPALAFPLQKLNAQVNLSHPGKVRWSLTTQLALNPPTSIRLEGAYDLGAREIRLRSQSESPLQSLIAYLPPEWVSKIKLLEGTALLDLETTGRLKGPMALKGLLQTHGLRWKVLTSQESRFLQGEGDLRAGMNARLPFVSRASAWNNLSGFIDLDRMAIGPFLPWGELKELTGRVKVFPQGIQFDRLTATLSGQPLVIEGNIENDEGRSIHSKLTTTMPLERLPFFLPKAQQKLARNAAWSGQVSLEIQGEGHLHPDVLIQPTLMATLQEASAVFPGIDPIQKISGTLHWKPDLLTVTELQGVFRNHPFHLDGSLVNFSQPEVDAHLAWGNLAADAQLTIDGEHVELHLISGHYGKSPFRLFGEIAGWKEPTGNLYGETSFRLEELAALLPRPPDWLKQLEAKGEISTRWILKGILSKPAEWEVGLKASSPSVMYREIELTQLTLDSKLAQGAFTLTQAKAGFSGGEALLTGTLDTHDPKKPWNAHLSLQAVELDSLAQILKWETQNLSGQLFLDWQGRGSANHWEMLQGNGSIRIGGGRILELPFLGGFADLLKLPTLRTLVFQEAQGPFSIREGTLRTNSFLLKSPQSTLTIVGSGGFLKGTDSPIDWRILPTLSPELIPQESRSKIGKVIAKGTSYFVGEIQITGTWKNPKRTFVPKPVTQILNEQLFNLQDLLKGLF